MPVLNYLRTLYKNEPTLCNAGLALLGIVIQHFVLNYGTDIKVAVDGFLVAIAAAVTRQTVTPVAKLKSAGVDPNPPKVQP